MRLLTPLPFRTDWTPEQAMAVHRWLQTMANAIWDHYQDELLELIEQTYHRDSASPPAQPDLFDQDWPF